MGEGPGNLHFLCLCDVSRCKSSANFLSMPNGSDAEIFHSRAGKVDIRFSYSP